MADQVSSGTAAYRFIRFFALIMDVNCIAALFERFFVQTIRDSFQNGGLYEISYKSAARNRFFDQLVRYFTQNRAMGRVVGL